MFTPTRRVPALLVAASCALAAGSAAAQTPVTGPAGTVTPPPDVLERQTPTPVLGPGERLADDMIVDVAQLTALDWPGHTGARIDSFTARPWDVGVVPIAARPHGHATRTGDQPTS
jgi:hypothetical protein